MAWWSIYKWCAPWRKTPLFDWIQWYSDSLKTPEQLEQERIEREKRAKEGMRALAMVFGAYGMVENMLPDSYFKQELRKARKDLVDLIS